MTTEERIELLKAVAGCAPKEMGAFYDEGCSSCDFSFCDERKHAAMNQQNAALKARDEVNR